MGPNLTTLRPRYPYLVARVDPPRHAGSFGPNRLAPTLIEEFPWTAPHTSYWKMVVASMAYCWALRISLSGRSYSIHR